MTYEPKPGSFTLFKNNKDGNEKRPDYTGDGMDLDGRLVRVSAWIKQGKNAKFMSCNMQLKRTEENRPQEKKDSGSPKDMEDDKLDKIPF